ncbi:conserved exported hypothetical protein [Paraburkholderia ribeironis]|uniref:Uncharacterized protein n=1 Tax=Paraburkholderia ribeironis TaxID=1247936 RepID=A0A1N7SLE6_9BURK|nr:hypothetical protein [Paraburkholderia ribeironis]SIT48198.1 conserved exported hypothetical protein [Paraburkholderia ribeironis]
MRTISAALICAGAVLPLLAHAATAVPDPTDAAASMPVASASSAFDGYRAYEGSYEDGEAPSWQQLNRAVTPSRRMTGMQRAQQPGATPDGKSGHEQSGREHEGETK